jgi:hypothetical protein
VATYVRNERREITLISYGLWQRRFGRQDVIGKTLHLTAGVNDRNYTIIGVAPKDFWFYGSCDVFVAVGATNEMWLKQRMEREGSRVIARLKPGAQREKTLRTRKQGLFSVCYAESH